MAEILQVNNLRFQWVKKKNLISSSKALVYLWFQRSSSSDWFLFIRASSSVVLCLGVTVWGLRDRACLVVVIIGCTGACVLHDVAATLRVSNRHGGCGVGSRAPPVPMHISGHCCNSTGKSTLLMPRSIGIYSDDIEGWRNNKIHI